MYVFNVLFYNGIYNYNVSMYHESRYVEFKILGHWNIFLKVFKIHYSKILANYCNIIVISIIIIIQYKY